MAASRLRLLNSKAIFKFNGFKSDNRILNSFYCTQPTDDKNVTEETSKKHVKWVDFYNKQQSFVESPETKEKTPQSFPALLRRSKFIDLGNPKNKVVEGTIYHTTGNDLYIDFGWKFPAVCLRPAKSRDSYIVGTKVKLLIKDLELATKFLGSTSDVTLCEADCMLLGVLKNN